jgi:hypothetical protein
MNLPLTKLSQLPPVLTNEEICEELEISLQLLMNVHLAQLAKTSKSLDMKLGSEGDGVFLSEMLCDQRSNTQYRQIQVGGTESFPQSACRTCTQQRLRAAAPQCC